MNDLEVAWVAAFPQTPTMRSQPVIVGNTIFIAATDSGRLYALDTNSGCVKWHYLSDMTLRSSLAFAEATDQSPRSYHHGRRRRLRARRRREDRRTALDLRCQTQRVQPHHRRAGRA